ncbi:hypothetical protein [Actinacidiphila yanglinensis]|uniref:hypothetical protein n=1 Tax=Actinacidiphila yanglinensis TaxID=310779 RepID=UPI0011B07EEA|nr:hypothetical protein [Actinacidiphila yanglinensis]
MAGAQFSLGVLETSDLGGEDAGLRPGWGGRVEQGRDDLYQGRAVVGGAGDAGLGAQRRDGEGSAGALRLTGQDPLEGVDDRLVDAGLDGCYPGL